MSEFIYLNRLALRLIRFKFNRLINIYFMKKQRTFEEIMASPIVRQQVKDRMDEIEARKEVQQKEGVSPREAEKILKARARAKAKAERLQEKFKSKGWVKK